MKTAFTILALLLVAGCANRQPSSSEMMVQSKRAAGDLATSSSAAAAPPFCLHIRYSNEFKYILTQNDAQAWVTDGSCATDGPRRPVADLILRWRYQHDSTGVKSCTASDSCVLSEPNVGEGKKLVCVSGTARDRGLEAALSTDDYACAK